MIDLQRVPPEGSLRCKAQNKDALWLFGAQQDGSGRMYAKDWFARHGAKGNLVFLEDIVTNDPVPVSFDVLHKPYEYMKKNKLANLNENAPHIHHTDPPLYDTVIICGSGPSLQIVKDKIEKYRDETLPVITVGSAQQDITGDYYCGVEWRKEHMGNLRKASFKQTHALLDTCVFPRVARLPWKSASWFSCSIEADVPILFGGENTAVFAIQYAIRLMKAKKVILCGMEHDKCFMYKVMAKFIEAIGWWAGRSDIELWNCSFGGNLVNGVIHGTLEEALGI